MGLLDVLNGMQNGPRGQHTPGTTGGGMSPMTMALLGLLAYKTIKSFTGNQPNVASAKPGAVPGTTPGAQSTGSASGGLGDLLEGGLGGLLCSLMTFQPCVRQSLVSCTSLTGRLRNGRVTRCPLYLLKQTSLSAIAMSVKCKRRHYAAQQLIAALGQVLPNFRQ
jgi:hypothetical protein